MCDPPRAVQWSAVNDDLINVLRLDLLRDGGRPEKVGGGQRHNGRPHRSL